VAFWSLFSQKDGEGLCLRLWGPLNQAQHVRGKLREGMIRDCCVDLTPFVRMLSFSSNLCLSS